MRQSSLSPTSSSLNGGYERIEQILTDTLTRTVVEVVRVSGSSKIIDMNTTEVDY